MRKTVATSQRGLPKARERTKAATPGHAPRGDVAGEEDDA